MISLAPGWIERQPIPQRLLQTIRLLGEFKGKQTLFNEQSPQLLEALRQTAIIQSTLSSNRIEGIVAPLGRIKQLVAHRTIPRNRSEQEIAGYRDALNTIHANHAAMPFTTGMVLQLHRDLYQFTSAPGGRWKSVDNQITETDARGHRMVRFTPAPAYQTPAAMEHLHERFAAEWERGEIEPLLLIPAYVLDFLCIHPFLDGNGRMARLLTLLLLYKAGYEVGRYVSIEQVVERTRESYYETLYLSSQGWHQAEHSLLPWTEYLLGVAVLSAYREFERRVGTLTTARGAKQECVRDMVRRLLGEFTTADLERACPGVSRATIRLVLADLKKQKQIRLVKRGPDARWEKLT